MTSKSMLTKECHICVRRLYLLIQIHILMKTIYLRRSLPHYISWSTSATDSLVDVSSVLQVWSQIEFAYDDCCYTLLMLLKGMMVLKVISGVYHRTKVYLSVLIITYGLRALCGRRQKFHLVWFGSYHNYDVSLYASYGQGIVSHELELGNRSIRSKSVAIDHSQLIKG